MSDCKVENLSTICRQNQIAELTVFKTNEPLQLQDLSFYDRIKLYCEVEAKSFYLRGKILQSIKEDKCYKEAGYKTFEKAVKDILDISRSFAYKIMDATATYEFLSTNWQQNLPTTESQIRPLIGLEPEQQVSVWQEVAKDRVPTAKEVQEAVNRRLGKSVSVKKTKVPMATVVDTTKYIDIVLYEQAQERIKELQNVIDTLLPYIDKVVELEEKVKAFGSEPLKPEEKSTLIKRQTAYNFVKERGNEFQTRALLNDNLVNADLYRIFSKVRETYKLSTPPPAWDTDIINATGIAD